MAARDLRAVLETAAVLATVRRLQDLEVTALPALAALLHADLVVYHEIDLSIPRERGVSWPREQFPPDRLVAYAEVMAEHPLVRHLPDVEAVGVLRISDVMTRLAWRSSRVYAESHRHLGVDDQMACVLGRIGPELRAVSLSRVGPAFTAAERCRLQLVRPHLTAAVERAHAGRSPCLALEVVPVPQYVQLESRPPRSALLTAREQEVMELLARGRSRGQIARVLACSPRTVDKHVERIHAKYGVSNRVAAIEAWTAD